MARDCYDDCIAYLDEQLGRLLGELERRGLLAETDVIITSDHGEAFGDHGIMGHSLQRQPRRDPRPAGDHLRRTRRRARVVRPVSLRDLPATVVDRLGLAEGSPFPGRSLAAYWGSSPGGSARGDHHPRLLGAGQPTDVRIPSPDPGAWSPGSRCPSCRRITITSGTAREASGSTIWPSDPFEKVNLMESAERKHEVDAYRRMLLKVLTENPGSAEVERDYLASYRQSLKAARRGGSRSGTRRRPRHRPRSRRAAPAEGLLTRADLRPIRSIEMARRGNPGYPGRR